jgi:hypothetical protein
MPNKASDANMEEKSIHIKYVIMKICVQVNTVGVFSCGPRFVSSAGS